MNGTDYLKRVVDMGEALVAKQKDLEIAENAAKVLKAEVLQLEREELPTLMQEAGITEVKLAASGKTITVKNDCDTKISDANKPGAFAWLLKNGFGGLIKTNVEVQFGRGEHDDADAAAASLTQAYPKNHVELDETVHPQTLKAFVKERMEAGEPVPADLFGVYMYSKAVVKN